MPYKVDWLIEDEILLYVFWGEMTSDDLRNSFSEVVEIITRLPDETIHTISDIRGVTYNLKMQDTMRVVKEFGNSIVTRGWSVTVGKLDIVAKMGIAISRTVLKNNTISFKTMDEALEHLKKNNEDISWDRLNQDVLDFASSKNS